MSAPVFEVPLSVGSAMANAAGDDVVVADFAFGFWSGAEWFAAGMAVCAFLEDLAALHVAQRGPTTPCAACGEIRGRHCVPPPPLGVVCMECCGEFREVTP